MTATVAYMQGFVTGVIDKREGTLSSTEETLDLYSTAYKHFTQGWWDGYGNISNLKAAKYEEEE